MGGLKTLPLMGPCHKDVVQLIKAIKALFDLTDSTAVKCYAYIGDLSFEAHSPYRHRRHRHPRCRACLVAAPRERSATTEAFERAWHVVGVAALGSPQAQRKTCSVRGRNRKIFLGAPIPLAWLEQREASCSTNRATMASRSFVLQGPHHRQPHGLPRRPCAGDQ